MKPHTFRYNYESELEITIKKMVKDALCEDLNSEHSGSDITAELIPETTISNASLISRETGIFCGREWFAEVFKQLDQNVEITWGVKDGDVLSPDMEICQLDGSARSILTGERVAMNFVQTLSATATLTHKYVKLLEGTTCRLLDTRKTLPGFRLAQKYAVKCGGGHNHRIGLFDAYLIKENHIMACGGINNAITKARENYPNAPIEIEVENLDEFKTALQAGAEVIMLDNFSNEDKLKAVEINSGKAALEASGNIDERTIMSVAETGVDYISVGAITKHIQALDLSLRLLS